MLELQWAARRLLEILAADAPLLAVIDDIHWAEPTLLEWLEHVLDASTGAPILLLTTARHDLLEERPGWGERGSERVVLAPLSDAASSLVVANLIGSTGIAPAIVDKVVRAAEGNPLYVEQMLSMLVDGGALRAQGQADVEIAMPPSTMRCSRPASTSCGRASARRWSRRRS